ncbi:tetratricopeptide repeat protein [Halomonas koreensis]|uniref:Sel1 repeat family protein n=1 Tax=Halomonas koreensis TaxID=245385 RepID=A0ABU1G6W7_9GAMM|nr:sel1 repeat family protein [Halomonas koreensis]MDR5868671.1 sel1 repeat family protein [Halomonas koreensis]
MLISVSVNGSLIISKKVKLLLASALLIFSSLAWGLEDEIQAAKDSGMIDYNLGYVADAIPKLEVAAEAGDVEAMYYLGESHRITHMGMTSDALEWYLKAAEHNDPYAMLRLWSGGACVAGDECPENAEGWREKARDEQLPLAEEGDADAMLALYYIYGALDDSDAGSAWLEKAAEAGNPEAQDRLAKMIQDGHGFYWSEGGRLEAAETLARGAAEQGYVPAMLTLSGIWGDKGEAEESWEWKVSAAESGMVGPMLGVAYCYLNPEKYQELGGNECLAGQDKVKGWAILYAMVEESGNQQAESLMERSRDLLTYDQRQKAEALAEVEWLNHGPPLSKFPPRYGF